MNLLLIHDADEIRARVLHLLAEGAPQATLELWDPTRQGAPGRGFPWSKYDVVFLDERPASADGIDWLMVLRDARRKGLVPPMVLVTGLIDAAREQRARHAGAADVVQKTQLSAARVGESIRMALAAKVAPPPAPATPLPVGAIGQAVDPSTIDVPGYRVLRKIGEGGMSKVYLAEREADRLLLVLKILDPTLHADPLFRQRFVREYQVLQRISNDHVVKIHDQAMSDRMGYIAMEFFAGGDLKVRVRPPGMPPGNALAVFVQIIRALDAVHQIGVVHRDLKPQNIMFRNDRQAALADFGLAREIDSTSTLTQKGVVLATPLYMSPEQCLGLPQEAAGDLYSAGVILYEMLTGHTPYIGKSPPELAYLHVHGKIPRLAPHLLSFQPLIDALLAKNPQDRPQSARVILDRIDRS
jgi:eukaryotic-like serine/threonine-protein kinase